MRESMRSKVLLVISLVFCMFVAGGGITVWLAWMLDVAAVPIVISLGLMGCAFWLWSFASYLLDKNR